MKMLIFARFDANYLFGHDKIFDWILCLKKPLPLASSFDSVPGPIFRELPRYNKNNKWFLLNALKLT